jgi:sugar phosphate isomerase/epimerase
MPGCCGLCCCGCKAEVALQLYSIRTYIGGKKDKSGKELVKGVGLAQALKDVAAIGYKGVEFAGYYGNDPQTLKAMLADAGLVVCGTHVANNMYGFDTKAGTFNPDVLKKTCAFELAYGNSLIICPGGGNIPPGANWSTGRGGDPCPPSQAIDDFTKKLVELYNKAAEVAKAEGCKIGLHNHTWEHGVKMRDGTSFWDYFFTNTSKDVCMEQDVGWTTCAGDMFPGLTAVEQYKKYPHRSPTLHAKENGMGKDVKQFDAILGQPGKPGATPVPWDDLFPVTDADGVKWYVVECERHEDTFDAIKPSIEFLRSKGRV